MGICAVSHSFIINGDANHDDKPYKTFRGIDGICRYIEYILTSDELHFVNMRAGSDLSLISDTVLSLFEDKLNIQGLVSVMLMMSHI